MRTYRKSNIFLFLVFLLPGLVSCCKIQDESPAMPISGSGGCTVTVTCVPEAQTAVLTRGLTPEEESRIADVNLWAVTYPHGYCRTPLPARGGNRTAYPYTGPVAPLRRRQPRFRPRNARCRSRRGSPRGYSSPCPRRYGLSATDGRPHGDGRVRSRFRYADPRTSRSPRTARHRDCARNSRPVEYFGGTTVKRPFGRRLLFRGCRRRVRRLATAGVRHVRLQRGLLPA